MNIDIQLPYIENQVELLSKLINKELSNMELLKSKPDLFLERNTKSPTIEAIIYSYRSDISRFKNQKSQLLLQKNDLEKQLDTLNNDNLMSGELMAISKEKNSLEKELVILEGANWEAFNLSSSMQNKEERAFETILNILDPKSTASEDIFKLTQEKDTLEKQLFYLETHLESGALFPSIQNQEMSAFEAILNILDPKSTLSEEIFKLTQEKASLESQASSLKNKLENTTTSSMLMTDITPERVDPKNFRILLFSATFGFIFSIFLVLFKQYFIKEKEA
jgi:hypothetical protein